MVRLALASTLLLLAACQQEPSFEERYTAAQQKVGSTARELDSEMVKADRQALEAAGRGKQKGDPPPVT